MRVAIHYRSHGREAKALAQETKGWALSSDLSLGRDAELLLARVDRKMGPVQLLIHNASVFHQGGLDLSQVDLGETAKVNFRAPFLLTRSFVNLLPKDREGVVIGLVDYRAFSPGKENLVYTAYESALVSLLKGVQNAHTPLVRTGIVALGPILPPEKGPTCSFEKAVSLAPGGVAGTPRAVGEGVIALASGQKKSPLSIACRLPQ